MHKVDEIWNMVLTLIEERSLLSPVSISMWFSKVKPVKLERDTFYITVEQDEENMIKDIIDSRYASMVSSCLEEIFSAPISLVVLTADQLEKQDEKKEGGQSPRDGYTFDRFVVGETNQMAFATSLSVAKNPGNTGSNPLFIYGKPGLGKTHLLFAIANEIRKNHPEKKIVYIHAESWVNELIQVIHESSKNAKARDDFQNKYRYVDVFLMDDVQFLAGKESSQNELFNTFNALHLEGKQIIFTSDRPPHELKTIPERLTTRFAWGGPIDIKSPDFETRMAIIKSKTARMGIELPPTIIQLLSEEITSNVRLIEGYLNKIMAYKDFIGGENLTEEAIINVIKDVFKESGDIVPTPQVIIDEVCKYCNIEEGVLRGPSRQKDIMTSRQIAIYLIKTLLNSTWSDLGREFSGRDHTTIMSSFNTIERRIANEPNLTRTIEDIKETINEKYSEASLRAKLT